MKIGITVDCSNLLGLFDSSEIAGVLVLGFPVHNLQGFKAMILLDPAWRRFLNPWIFFIFIFLLSLTPWPVISPGTANNMTINSLYSTDTSQEIVPDFAIKLFYLSVTLRRIVFLTAL